MLVTIPIYQLLLPMVDYMIMLGKDDLNNQIPYDICAKLYSKKTVLQVNHCPHKTNHTFFCELCNLQFNHLIHVRTHMNKCHQKSSASQFQCCVCMRVFPTFMKLVLHDLDMHKVFETEIICALCTQITTIASAERMISHYTSQHNNELALLEKLKNYIIWKNNAHNKFCCTLCFVECSPFSVFMKHLNEAHNINTSSPPPQPPLLPPSSPLPSSSSSLPSPSSSLLAADISSENGLTCQFCNSVFTIVEDMIKHIVRSHWEDENKCLTCHKEFVGVGAAKKHFRSYRCPVLQKHLSAFEVDTPGIYKDAKSVQCPECDTMCTNSSMLNVHMRKHTGERPFQCDQCERSFTQIGNFNKHKELMHGDINRKSSNRKCRYPCGQCGRKFITMADVRAHERIHTGEKPFTCPHCRRGFTQRGNLNIHLKRWHLGIKELPFGSPPAFDVKKTTFGKHHVGNDDAAEFKMFHFTVPTKEKKKGSRSVDMSNVIASGKSATIDNVDSTKKSSKCESETSDKEKFIDGGGVISKFRIEKPKTLAESVMTDSTPPSTFSGFSIPDGHTSSTLTAHEQRLLYLPINMDMLGNEYCVDSVEENGYASTQTQVLNHAVITSITDIHTGNEVLPDCSNDIMNQIHGDSYLQNNELSPTQTIEGLSKNELDVSQCLPMYTEVIDHTNGGCSYFHEEDSPQQQQHTEATHDDHDINSITSTSNCLVLYTGVIDHVKGDSYLHKDNTPEVIIHEKGRTNSNVITSTHSCLGLYNKVGDHVVNDSHYFGDSNQDARQNMMASKLQQESTSMSTRNDCLGLYTEVIDHIGEDPYFSKNNSPQQQEEGVFPINNDDASNRHLRTMNVDYLFQDSPSTDIQDGDDLFSKGESTVNPNEIMFINWMNNHSPPPLPLSSSSSKQTLNPNPTVIKNVSGGEIRDIYTQPLLY